MHLFKELKLRPSKVPAEPNLSTPNKPPRPFPSRLSTIYLPAILSYNDTGRFEFSTIELQTISTIFFLKVLLE